MPPRPPKRRSAPTPRSQISKKTRLSSGLPQASDTRPAPPTDATTQFRDALLVRDMIFRGSQSYIPSPMTHSTPWDPAETSTSPVPRVIPKETTTPPNPLSRLLTDLQVLDRRVRLLLPDDGSIVFPGAAEVPSDSRSSIPSPQPDPTFWMNHYVRHFGLSYVCLH